MKIAALAAIAIALYFLFAKPNTLGQITGLPSNVGTGGLGTAGAGLPSTAAAQLAGGIANLEGGLAATLSGHSLAGPDQNLQIAGSLAAGQSLETTASPIPSAQQIASGMTSNSLGVYAGPAPVINVTPDNSNPLAGVLGSSVEGPAPPQAPTGAIAFDSSNGTIDSTFDPSAIYGTPIFDESTSSELVAA